MCLFEYSYFLKNYCFLGLTLISFVSANLMIGHGPVIACVCAIKIFKSTSLRVKKLL